MGAKVGVREMARRLGVSASTYSHYEDPRRFKDQFLPMSKAIEFADALETSGVQRGMVLSLAGAQDDSDATEDLSRSTMVDVYDVRASAGHGAVVPAHEDIIDRLSFPPEYLRRITKTSPAHLAIIGVKGDSMETTLRDDDVVMIDLTKTSLDYDGLFVLRWGDALHVKRIGRASNGSVRIISDNAAIYPATEMERSEIDVVGKVIWMGKKV